MSDAFRSGLRPPSDLLPPDWASKKVSLQNSERSAKFDISQTPWWRDPMNDAADPRVKQVVVMAPTGSGKSAMAEGLIPWAVSESPGAFLYASQTDPDAKFWAETRLFPALRSCDEIKKLWPADKNKSRTAEILFPHMPLLCGGANMSNFQEKSCRWLYGDEVWAWKKGLVREFLARHHNRWNRKVYLVSQAGVEDDDLHLEFKKTNQALWSWECECGSVHAWDAENLKYDKITKEDGSIDDQATADTARMVCPDCEKVHQDKVRTRRRMANNSKYVAQTEGHEGYRGYKMHRLSVWWIPWSDFVLKRLSALKQLKMGDVTEYRQLKQKDECVPWKDDMGVTRKSYKLTGFLKTERNPLEKINGETHRLFTLDRGGDHFWGTIRAWAKGQSSELLWEGYVQARGENEGHIEELRNKYGVRPEHTLVDVGYETADTYELCARCGYIGIRGNGQVRSYRHTSKRGTVEKLYSPIKIGTGTNGSRCKYFEIATDPVKDVLWRLINGAGLEWSIPEDVSKAYKRHMRAEVRKSGQKGRSKETVGYWETVDRHNHLWDCEVYNVAGAMVMGVFEG